MTRKHNSHCKHHLPTSHRAKEQDITGRINAEHAVLLGNLDGILHTALSLCLMFSIPPMALMFCVSMMVSQRRWHFMTWLKWSMVCMEMSTSSRILSLLSTNTSCADAPITACMQLCQAHSHSVSFAPTSTSSLCTHWVDGQHLETSRVDRKALVISQSKRRREESVVLGLVVALITPIARLFTHPPSRDVQQHTTQPCLFVEQWSRSCQRR